MIRTESNTAPDTRVAWLDGLRGLAAVQVVLLHYTSAFLPAIGLKYRPLIHSWWETYFIGTPWFLPFDGYLAVNLFFILSGTALTWSFSSRPFAIGRALVRRVVRLGIPMAAALTFGAILLTILPHAHLQAAIRSGSQPWLSASSAATVTPWGLIHQILFEGLLTGFAANSFLPPSITAWLGSVASQESYNGPLWTLHIEFVGSLLIMVLVAFRALLGRWVHGLFCLGLGWFLITTPLVLFVIGHGLAPWLEPMSRRRWLMLPGTAALIFGIWFANQEYSPLLTAVFAALPPTPAGQVMDREHWQSMAAAVSIFFGLAMSPVCQNVLCRGPMRYLGRISFALYLTHFPVLCTFACAAFVAALPWFTYGRTVGLVSVVGIAIGFAVASAFEHWIDRPAIALSRRIGAGPRRHREGSA